MCWPEPGFVRVAPLSDEALQAVLQRIIRHVLKLLARPGVLIDEHGQTYLAGNDCPVRAQRKPAAAFRGGATWHEDSSFKGPFSVTIG